MPGPIINDITGGRGDSEMLALIAAAQSCVHHHAHARDAEDDADRAELFEMWCGEVGDFFRQQYGCALECGIDPMAIAFDPGIGFGKTLEHNLELLRNLSGSGWKIGRLWSAFHAKLFSAN